MNTKLGAAADAARDARDEFLRARHVLREWHQDRDILLDLDVTHELGDVLDEALEDYLWALKDWEKAKGAVKAFAKKAKGKR